MAGIQTEQARPAPASALVHHALEQEQLRIAHKFNLLAPLEAQIKHLEYTLHPPRDGTLIAIAGNGGRGAGAIPLERVQSL